MITPQLPTSNVGPGSREPGHQWLASPGQDMMEWVALWGTGFMCYVADTQYWFVLGCGLLGCVLALLQRGSDLHGSLWHFVSWLHGPSLTHQVQHMGVS